MFTKLMVIFLILMPTVNSWPWNTHQNIVEYVYLSLPIEIQMQLNLTKLKEGAIVPDRDFKDYKNHHYPNSLHEAEKWLENDTDLSFNLGIASHYITDSFSAPHNIFGEDYKLHSNFENQVKNYYPDVECNDYGFEPSNLSIAEKNSKDWKYWLKTKNKEIPKKEVDEATRFLFSVVLNKLNSSCGIKTEVTEVPYINKIKIIFITLMLLVSLYVFKN